MKNKVDPRRAPDALGPYPADPVPTTGVGPSPSQAAVLAALRRAPEPPTLVGLATSMGLHPNTVREHLIALESGGHVHKERAEPQGRGRPAWRYRPAASTEGSGGEEYAALAATLAAAVAEAPDAAERAAAAGWSWGEGLARTGPPVSKAGGPAIRRAVVDLLDRLRFAPSADTEAIRLTRCPLLDAARDYPEVVCSVHAGIIRGALHTWGDEASATRLVPFAEPGACVVHLEPTPPRSQARS